MNNIEEDKELERDMLLRECRVRYPEVEDWVLQMAVKAYLNLNGEKFVSNYEEGEKIKQSYSQDLEYTTV
jgi:predicted enzyme involved in methoxymalonyl-ACP biosynthesis